MNSLRHQDLAPLLTSYRTSQTTMGAHVEGMFVVLDKGQTGATVGMLIDRVVGSRTAAQGVKSGLLRAGLAVEKPRDRGMAARLTPTETTEGVAQSYNTALMESIASELPSLTQGAVGALAIRKHAISHQIDPDQPLASIVGEVSNREGWHPHSVMYRALGGFAFDQGVFAPAFNEVELAIKSLPLPNVNL